ncbi:hypothetical protein BGW42_007814 [Actinomortierella wolfii]|nr:hypothetical protein BGW42_007814 [Actinomortierella wolfii]
MEAKKKTVGFAPEQHASASNTPDLGSSTTAPRPINTSGARTSYESMRSSYEEQWGLADRVTSSQKSRMVSPRDGAGFPKDGKKDKRQSIVSPTGSNYSPGTPSSMSGGLGIQHGVSSPSADQGQQSPQQQQQQQQQQAGGQQQHERKGGAPSQKSMTKAERRELQEKQRAAKAAARAAAGLPPQGGGGGGAGGAGGGSKKGTPSTPQSSSTFSPNPSKQLATSFPGAETEKAIAAAESSQAKKREKLTKEIGLFAHLDPPKFANTASAPKELHPAVVNVGLQMAQFKICGANARCVATLNAFRKAILDYQAPPNTTLSRSIQAYLNPHINYLVSCRPMAVSMGNAIRYLKYEIGENLDLPDEDARALFVEKIDNFIRDRITVADQIIREHGMQKIQDGDVILTYARSSVIEGLLLAAHAKNIKFRVIVVDSRPRFEGKQLLKSLANAGIDCTYVLLTAIGYAMKEVNKVFLGAHSLLSNGALYSRAGTAVVAMTAHERKIPVIVCCETYKFSDRVQLDSFVQNEIGNPDELVNDQTNNYGHSSERYHDNIRGSNSAATTATAGNRTAGNGGSEAVLSNWREMRDLKLLNLLYDLTPSEFVTVVITELLYLGREYPAGEDFFHQRLKAAFQKNSHLTDPKEIQKRIDLGDYVCKEIEAMYHINKYRAMKKRYYEDHHDHDLAQRQENIQNIADKA